MTKSGERKIDLCSFLESITCSSSLALSFATSKIDNIEFSDLDMWLSIFLHLWALNSDGEYRMTSWRFLVHIGSTNMTISVTFGEYIHEVFWGFYNECWKIFDVHSRIFIFKIQFLLTIFEEQVSNFFIIYLKIRCTDKIFFAGVTLNHIKDRFKGARHYSFQFSVRRNTINCECLSSTSLTICKDCTIITL